MPEIIVRQMRDTSGDLHHPDGGLNLPADHFSTPYTATEYTFRLEELNGQITGPQPIGKLNSFATMLSDLSEYERTKLEGAVLLTDCKTIEDCTKLMYNLDAFELTPGAGDYKSLGKYWAENDFADALKGVPKSMMEHFDYDLLGRIGWDDSTNVFINGHRIRDTEKELHNADQTHDPNPTYLKLRFVSDQNPDGVWMKFPLSGMGAIDAPDQSDEMMVALKSLGVDSIDECRVKSCESRYPVLTKCMEYSEGSALSELIWQAHNLGLAESELSQYGADAYDKFAAALEYEDSGNLNFAADITQNLHLYDFAPDMNSYAEKYLQKRGVDTMMLQCFNLKALGETLAAGGAVTTASGVISRNEHDFVFDYYQPEQEHHPQEQEIKLYCPLEVRTDPDSTLAEEYGEIVSEFEDAVIPNSVAADYKNEILAALEKERGPEEQERGLAAYLDSGLAEKVSYIWPSVEVFDNDLYGVFNIRTAELTSQEMVDLTDYCIGQASDGLGESVEQRPIKTSDGNLYVSLWQHSDDYFMMPEQDFKQMFPEQEHGMQMNL